MKTSFFVKSVYGISAKILVSILDLIGRCNVFLTFNLVYCDTGAIGCVLQLGICIMAKQQGITELRQLIK